MKWPDEVFAVKSRKGPAPHGAGGLKSQALCLMQPGSGSRPARGGWIEISVGRRKKPSRSGPAPHGAGGLKFFLEVFMPWYNQSRPARGGWIEIHGSDALSDDLGVPPRTGRVD